MLRTHAPLSRRTTLGAAGLLGAVGLAGLSGCSADLDALRPPDASPAPSATADKELVDTVVRRLRTASRGTSRPFRHLHTVHLDVLGSPPEPTGGKKPSAEVIRRREHALPDQLTEAALQAGATDLVRLFASMAAAQRQLLDQRPEVI